MIISCNYLLEFSSDDTVKGLQSKEKHLGSFSLYTQTKDISEDSEGSIDNGNLLRRLGHY